MLTGVEYMIGKCDLNDAPLRPTFNSSNRRNTLKLTDLIRPFEAEFKIFEARFSAMMESQVPLIDSIAKYLVKHKGKNLRPLLVLMSSKICGTPSEHSYTSAVVVELLHTATLVHDDVIDDADLRRGFPSIKAKWQNKIAILIGDYLLSKSLIGASDTDNIRVIRILSTAAKRLTRGELNQLQRSKKMNMSEADYIDMISDKTAALISACAELGAVTTTEDETIHAAMRSFGENLGIAFQIKDDLLDYQSTAGIIGKPAGADLKEQKLTLPIIHALSRVDDSEARKIRKRIKKSMKRSDISDIITFVESNQGIKYADGEARRYAELAKAELAIFPDSDAKTSIFNFIDYVITRRK